MSKKALTKLKKEIGEGEKDNIIGEDKDTKRWDEMTTQDVCKEGMENLKFMFQTGFKAIKCLAYIEMKGRWRDLEEYKEHTFSYFVEDYFGIRAGSYFNMKGLAHRYQEKNFNKWGLQTLKRVEGTLDPEKTLAQLNALPQEGGRIKGTEIRRIINQNKPQYPIDGVFTPWSVQRQNLVTQLQAKIAEVERLQDRVVALEIKIEQLEDENKRLRQ